MRREYSCCSFLKNHSMDTEYLFIHMETPVNNVNQPRSYPGWIIKYWNVYSIHPITNPNRAGNPALFHCHQAVHAHLPVGVQTAKCPPFVILGSTAIHSRIRDNCFQSFLRHIVRTESLFSPFPDKAESYNHLKLLSEAYKMRQAWHVWHRYLLWRHRDSSFFSFRLGSKCIRKSTELPIIVQCPLSSVLWSLIYSYTKPILFCMVFRLHAYGRKTVLLLPRPFS